MLELNTTQQPVRLHFIHANRLTEKKQTPLQCEICQYLIVTDFVTSAEEGGYVFGSVCLSVCLSVRRITRKVVNGF